MAKLLQGRIAVVVDDEHLVDITELLGVDTAEWPPVAPTRLVADFDAWRPRIEAALPGMPRIAVRDVTLRTPIPWPNKVIAYPVNYHDHGREMQAGYRADHQGFFLKPSSALSGPNDPVVLPQVPGREVHHESELGIVIGKGGERMKAISTGARAGMEKLFGRKVFLETWCKVREGWSDDEAALRRFGYSD